MQQCSKNAERHLDQESGLDAMFAFEGGGKVSEHVNEAAPDDLALHLRVGLALHQRPNLEQCYQQQSRSMIQVAFL